MSDGKRPRGRPKTTGTSPIKELRIPEAEFAKQKEAADAQEMKWSTWAREVLNRVAARQLGKLRRLRDQQRD